MLGMIDFQHTNWTATYVLVEWVIRLSALMIIPLRRPPSAATAWLLLIFFQPMLGMIFYLFVGRPRVSRARQQKIDTLERALAPNLQHLQQQQAAHTRTVLPERLQPVAQLARHWSVLPEFGGNSVQLLETVPAFSAQLVRDIEAARHSIHLLFYIAARDSATEAIFDALVSAAQRGIEVRLIIDDFGSREFMKPLLALEAQGLRVARAFPRSKLPHKAARFDLRNHRKLIVVDGVTGYAGSMNLIRPDSEPPIVYEDIMLRLQGPVVLELQTVFAGDWYIERNVMLTGEQYFPVPIAVGREVCIGLPSGPEYPDPVQQHLLLSLIHVSTQSIRIVTPYFVPDEPTLIALKTAAQRGVEVELILSARLDQWFVQWAQESYYTELLEIGVLIRCYPTCFLHTKFALFDDRISLIGSANLDVRSSLINAELGLLFYTPGTAEMLQRLLDRYRETAVLLEEETWASRSRFATLRQNIARLTNPLL
ncbi:cardiolipin synthase [Halothiobacillus diazotrophicus]|nr:cardiolipin synthase [Halothiobacillus diazotrophicus]